VQRIPMARTCFFILLLWSEKERRAYDTKHHGLVNDDLFFILG